MKYINWWKVTVRLDLQGTIYVKQTIFSTKVDDIHTVQKIEFEGDAAIVESLPNDQRQSSPSRKKRVESTLIGNFKTKKHLP